MWHATWLIANFNTKASYPGLLYNAYAMYAAVSLTQ
jgi:hypothetical protein